MRILVTGANGLLGSSIVTAALNKNFEVFGSVRKPTANRFNYGKYREVFWDISASLCLTEALSNIDIFCHCICYKPKNPLSPTEIETCLKINAGGIAKAVFWAKEIGAKKFVYVSAGNAYLNNLLPVEESTQLYPIGQGSAYLMSIVAAENIAFNLCKDLDLPFLGLRASSLYGSLHYGQNLIGTLVRKILCQEPIDLYYDGKFKADFVWVDDIANLILSPKASNSEGLYNISSGEHRSIKEVIDIIATIGKVTKVEINYDKITRERAAAKFPVLKITRAKQELGFCPSPFSKGIKSVIADEIAAKNL